MVKNSTNRVNQLALLPALALLALAAVGSARAADLSVAPIYKAPPQVAAPAYNWSGFYVGVNGGGHCIVGVSRGGFRARRRPFGCPDLQGAPAGGGARL